MVESPYHGHTILISLHGENQQNHFYSQAIQTIWQYLLHTWTVGIHDGHCDNKVDGLFGLWRMNKRQVEQLAGASIKQ